MGSDLLERFTRPPTPERDARVAEAERMGRCPIEARRRTRASRQEFFRLVDVVLFYRSQEDPPSIRQLADWTGYSKSAIHRIVRDYC